MKSYWIQCLVIASLYCIGHTRLTGEVTGQWNFENELSAVVGQPLEYFDGETGQTDLATEFGSTESFGIPGPGGAVTPVMKLAKNSQLMGYVMRPGLPANGGGLLANQWSMVMDIYYPTESGNRPRAVMQIDDPFANSNAAEIVITASNGVGVLTGAGNLASGVWHRVVLTVDLAATPPVLKKYLDGVSLGEELLPVDPAVGALDGRWAILDKDASFGGDSVLLFSDNAGNSEIGYLSSLQMHDTVLSAGYVAALGGATASKIPATVTALASI